MKKLCLQLIKFGFVGGLCFIIDYGLLTLFTEVAGINYLISSAISFTISVLVNYLLSMRFVFEGREDVNRTSEMIIFVLLSIIGLGLNQLIMWLGVAIAGIYYLITKIFATFLVMIYNFITRKLLLEKH